MTGDREQLSIVVRDEMLNVSNHQFGKVERDISDRSTIISVIERAIHRIKIKKDEDSRKHAGSTEIQTFTNHGIEIGASKSLKSERLKSKDLLARIAALQ